MNTDGSGSIVSQGSLNNKQAHFSQSNGMNVQLGQMYSGSQVIKLSSIQGSSQTNFQKNYIPTKVVKKHQSDYNLKKSISENKINNKLGQSLNHKTVNQTVNKKNLQKNKKIITTNFNTTLSHYETSYSYRYFKIKIQNQTSVHSINHNMNYTLSNRNMSKEYQPTASSFVDSTSINLINTANASAEKIKLQETSIENKQSNRGQSKVTNIRLYGKPSLKNSTKEVKKTESNASKITKKLNIKKLKSFHAMKKNFTSTVTGRLLDKDSKDFKDLKEMKDYNDFNKKIKQTLLNNFQNMSKTKKVATSNINTRISFLGSSDKEEEENSKTGLKRQQFRDLEEKGKTIYCAETMPNELIESVSIEEIAKRASSVDNLKNAEIKKNGYNFYNNFNSMFKKSNQTKHEDYKKIVMSSNEILISNDYKINDPVKKEIELDDIFSKVVLPTDGLITEEIIDKGEILNVEDLNDNEEQENSGVLSYDDVKDIIKCFDFEYHDPSDHEIFSRERNENYSSIRSQRYIKSLFNDEKSSFIHKNTQVNSITSPTNKMLKNIIEMNSASGNKNKSISTKDSSNSHKKNYIIKISKNK